MPTPLETLDESQAILLAVVEGATDQLDAASPCSDYTVLQVISHSTHHRAQANTRLRMVGAEPPMVDYIAWLWRGRPKPEWPAAPQTVTLAGGRKPVVGSR